MALSKPARDYHELEGAALLLTAVQLIPDPEITVSSVTAPSLRPAVTLPMEEDRRARLSLTPKHAKQIMQLLKRVQNWWGRQYGDDDNGVFTFLGVPLSKQQEIREQCGSDEDTAVEKCIEWWLEHATDVSWRKILYSLDWAIETPVADSIRQYAEPPSDPRLTSHNVHQVMEVVRQERWKTVGMIVPDLIQGMINVSCSSDDEKMSAVVNYMINVIPGITWEDFAAKLYEMDEEEAVERVKPYLHVLHDPTLTTHNVVEMTKGVKYDDLRFAFGISYNTPFITRIQYQSEEQQCEALIAHVLSTHPCMSWKLIARGLQRRGYSEAAAEVTRKYVKGILIPSSCVSDLKQTLTRIAEQAAGLGAEDTTSPHT